MAAPALTGANVAVAFGSATTLAFTAPTRNPGDFLLPAGWIENSTKTPSAVTGYTSLGSAERAGEFEEFFWVRQADNTATDNFSTSWIGAANRFGEMRRITGAVEYVEGVTNSGSGTTFLVKGATAPRNECLGLILINSFTEHSISSPPSGWTAEGTWAPALKKELAVGPTGDLEGTFAASENWITKMLIFAPASPPAVGPRPGSLNLLGVGR